MVTGHGGWPQDERPVDHIETEVPLRVVTTHDRGVHEAIVYLGSYEIAWFRRDQLEYIGTSEQFEDYVVRRVADRLSALLGMDTVRD